jgi:hypothetical protein
LGDLSSGKNLKVNGNDTESTDFLFATPAVTEKAKEVVAIASSATSFRSEITEIVETPIVATMSKNSEVIDNSLVFGVVPLKLLPDQVTTYPTGAVESQLTMGSAAIESQATETPVVATLPTNKQVSSATSNSQSTWHWFKE